jgi:hypothetical protein
LARSAGSRRGAIDLLVQGLDELLRVLTATPDGGDRGERVEVVVVDVEHAVPVLEREVVTPSLRLEVRARRSEDVDAIVVFVRDVELTLEDVDELAPLLLLLVEVGEAVQRLRILAAQIEDDLPRVDRADGSFRCSKREVRDLRADLGLLDVADSRSRARARRPC